MTPKQKILIVDDRSENLVALRQVLKDTGAEIVSADSGNEALASTLDHSFALAILDVMMPGMNGYELAEHLRCDEATRLLPIIFVTALPPDEQHIFSGYESGAVDYIVKPYAPDILRAKVKIFLELDRQRQLLQWQRDNLDILVAERTKELEQALAQVKLLEGILPICMYCKKIRRDDQAWQHLESYITEHSEALFSHGICPDCFKAERWKDAF